MNAPGTRAIGAADRAAFRAERDALEEHGLRGFSLPTGATEMMTFFCMP